MYIKCMHPNLTFIITRTHSKQVHKCTSVCVCVFVFIFQYFFYFCQLFRLINLVGYAGLPTGLPGKIYGVAGERQTSNIEF